MASLPFKAAVAGSLSLAVVFAAGTAFLTQRVGASFECHTAELQSETPASEAREVGARLAVAAKTAEDLAVAAGALRTNGIANRAVYDTALRV